MIPFKRALLGWLLDTTSQLEGQATSQILPEIFSKVANTVEATKKHRRQSERINEVFGNILKVRDHQKLVHIAD